MVSLGKLTVFLHSIRAENHEETFGKTLLMRMSLHVRQIQMASTDQFDWIFSAWIRGKTKRRGERAKVEQRERLPVNTCVSTLKNQGTRTNVPFPLINQFETHGWPLDHLWSMYSSFVAGCAMTVTNLSPQTLYADLRMSQPTAKRGTYGRSLRADWHISWLQETWETGKLLLLRTVAVASMGVGMAATWRSS